MVKIHSFFGVFLTAFLILCLLVSIMIFYNIQSSRVQSLALESMTLLSDWNKLENRTNKILLSRYTVTDREIPPLLQNWNREYEEFSDSLEKLNNNKQIAQWKDLTERINGASRVWRYTKVQLNNANHFFKKIIQSGLGEKVMVNGFLYTTYKLRMEGQLTGSEIFLLDDTIYALESLDKATTEFDVLFTVIVQDLKETGEIYLKRIRLMIFGLFSTALFVLGVSFLFNNQLKKAQENRSVYLRRQKDQLLRGLCENSGEDNLEQFNSRKNDLGISLSLKEPIIPIMLQIDDYSSFSHQLNIGEQNRVIESLTETMEKILAEEKMTCESFLYKDDMIVFLSNTDLTEENDELLQRIKNLHNILVKNREWSVSMTMGNINTEAIDLDNDFSDLQKLAEYRFLLGKGAYIFSGATQLGILQSFQYPFEKERLFKEAMNSLKSEQTLNILDEMIEYGSSYGPRNMRRLILRLTASLSSIVETLERTYHITSMTDVIPMMLQVQNPENINGVRGLLTEIITHVVTGCLERKEEKHDQTVLQIKEIISGKINDFNLSADSIADRFNLTTSYLNRLFKQHTAFSIAGYINNIRLDHSEELLRCTNQTVTEIAEGSGFASTGTFFRLFKKKYGRTPRDYQREVKFLQD